MNEVDIGLFQFDYDLTWMAFFLDANERIYSRYGGRDAQSAEGRVSVAGLKHTMRRVLEQHRQPVRVTPAPRKPVLPGDLFAAKGKGCMHCHHVWEGLRQAAFLTGKADQELYFVYPLPENLGLELDSTLGNKVTSVRPKSPAHKAGLCAGDVLESIEKTRILAQGDVMWALHNAPAEGSLSLRYQRAGEGRTVALDLENGWKRTDLSWRKSLKKAKK
jgi:hypothetical protein